MAANFHEQFEDRVELPSDRSTGLVFAGASIAVAAIYHSHMTTLIVSLVLAVLFSGLSFLAPVLLRPLNYVWFQFGRLLHNVMNPLIMGVLFFLVITPFGYFMRWGYDPLRARIKRPSQSYWIDRSPTGATDPIQSMKNQF